MGNTEKKNCPICGNEAEITRISLTGRLYVKCNFCGQFEYHPDFDDFTKMGKNKFASYLIYNGYNNCHSKNEKIEYRYFSTRDKESCDDYTKAFYEGRNTHGHPVHLSQDNVERWFPDTFSEKMDQIILYLGEKEKRIGSSIFMPKEEALSVFFLERYELVLRSEVHLGDEEINEQLRYIYALLVNNGYIEFSLPLDIQKCSFDNCAFRLLSLSYERIDQLQKNKSNGKNVLVAMKFGDDTMNLRESIRSGVADAGFNAVFIDEVQHNEFITPELLKYIRDSKFVVVDLTHQNNGAYFEEGYAMGLGKNVIQLCKKNVSLHFDIAQKNTIFWNQESDIPLKLKNRIIATID